MRHICNTSVLIYVVKISDYSVTRFDYDKENANAFKCFIYIFMLKIGDIYM